jgi:hypothetical protein
MKDILRKLDLFPKATDDFRLKTNSGAIVSIISIILMLLLFVGELRYYLKKEVVDHLSVNTTRTTSLKVSFDISFPEIACNLVSLNAVDDTGLEQKDAVYIVYKHKLSKSGRKEGLPELTSSSEAILSESELEKLATEYAEKNRISETNKIECGNCYGAGNPGDCCNTCDDVKLAYDRIGWKFKPQGIAQCMKDNFKMTLKEQFAVDGGCQLFGQVQLNKASGHFHFAPHKKLHESGNNGLFNLMELISFTFEQFNITHTINSLSFGDHFPGISSPLDGQKRKVEDTHGMYQYYIKVVPTKYKSNNKRKPLIESNQYAVTEHMRHVSPGSGRGLPGVYFYYEVSPVEAVFEEKYKGSIWQFLTSLCAIVGGSFVVMGLVDVFVQYFGEKVQYFGK